MASALGIALALWLAPPQPVPSQPAPALCDVAVRVHEVDYEQFVDAAQLRLPGARLREAGGEPDPACVDRLNAYVELRPIDGERWELSLISSDGRAWFRTVTSEPDQAARALASTLANLVAAIEDASAEPDAVEVAIPTQVEEPRTQVEEPEPVEAEAAERSSQEHEPDDARAIVLELGPRLSGGVLVGLAPGPGWRGAGGGFGLDLRLPDGLGFGLDLRTSTAAAAELRLVRTRVALGVGWALRNGRFELPVIISGVIEPWVVRTAGTRTPLGQPPMIGGGARVAPGVALELGSVRVRLGLALGFEIAVEAANGGLTPAIAREPDSEPILRAGGVELSAGLECGVWIPIRERRRRSKSK